MSRMTKRFLSLTAILGGVLAASCDKTAVQKIAGPTDPLTQAQVRFFNFGLGAPGINFYANTTKLTAISSATCSPTPTDTVQQRVCRETGAESTSGVTYGNVGSGGLYASLAPGDYTLKGTIAATTDKDLAIATLSATLAAGKIYSFYTSGVYNTTAKTVEAFIVEDPIPAIDWAVSPIRFVNAISNAAPMTLVARDSTTKVETTIATDIAYKSAAAFKPLTPGLYELYVTVGGSATKVIQRTGVTFAPGRIYTISSRGDATLATGTNARSLDNTANR